MLPLLALALVGFVLLGKKSSTAAAPSTCPIAKDKTEAIMAPILLSSVLPDSTPKPTAANIQQARLLIQQLRACGQKADADLFQAGLYSVTKDSKDKPASLVE